MFGPHPWACPQSHFGDCRQSRAFGYVMAKAIFIKDHDLCSRSKYEELVELYVFESYHEFLAIAYWHEKRLPVIVARLFNIVGPRPT